MNKFIYRHKITKLIFWWATFIGFTFTSSMIFATIKTNEVAILNRINASANDTFGWSISVEILPL